MSDEEPRHKRASPHEVFVAANHNDSPTKRPPPDKQRQSDAIPRSVVTPEPPNVDFRGNLEPQVSRNDVRDTYAPSPGIAFPNRIWKVAPYLTEPQYRDRQRAPPFEMDQTQLRKLSIFCSGARGLPKETTSKKFIFDDLIDLLAYECLLQNLPKLLLDIGAIGQVEMKMRGWSTKRQLQWKELPRCCAPNSTPLRYLYPLRA